jgi:G:T/U-mismatch repair DNA glycosylase
MDNISEVHPYNSANPIPKGTRVLIVGTAPPERFSRPPGPSGDRSGDVRFYYGSRDNELWSTILPKITRFQLKHGDADARRQEMISFLKLNRIWMHDVYESYLRKRAGSSLDSNLQLVKAACIKRALCEHSTIEHVIFTGGRAERETCRQMVCQGIAGARGVAGKMPRSRTLDHHFEDGRRQIRLHVVPSPSAMTRRSGMTDVEKLAIYRQVLQEACPDLTAD